MLIAATNDILASVFFLQYYFGSAHDDEKATHRDRIGEIVTKMMVSKHF